MVTHIIKRRNHKERFDEKKLYASVYAACINCSQSEEESEKIADLLLKHVENRIKNKVEVDSKELKKIIQHELNLLDKTIGLMYKHHLDLC